MCGQTLQLLLEAVTPTAPPNTLQSQGFKPHVSKLRPELLQENTGTAWASSAGSLTAVGIQRVPELRNPGACQLADLALETCDENE